MTKHIQIRDAIYEKLSIGKVNNSFSNVIDKLIKDKEDCFRETGTLNREIYLLKQEIGLLKLRVNKDE